MLAGERPAERPGDRSGGQPGGRQDASPPDQIPSHQVAPAARADGIRCRQIDDADLGAVADLLSEGFPRRSKAGWTLALSRLAARQAPPGFPRYGFLLDTGQATVGVLLLICAELPGGAREAIRCNLSSWYVRPAFRLYASLLVSRVLKLTPDSFVNISPAESTWPVIEAQGFRRFSDGAFAAIPMLSPSTGADGVRAIDPAGAEPAGLARGEWRLLQDHHGFGCISLCGVSADGGHPFVFRRRRVERVPLACAHLVYCRDIADLTRFAGPIGRLLAMRGMPWMLVPSDEPVPGVVGRHFEAKLPMYYAGGVRPRPGDLAYTEAALFGF